MEALQKESEFWAPGIQYLSIRVTKPTIPKSINDKYLEIEKSKTMQNLLKEKRSTLISKEKNELNTYYTGIACGANFFSSLLLILC